MSIKMIWAEADHGVIGFEGRLPWYLPEDLIYFKKVTEYSTVVMGRITYESFIKPLENRRNVVLSYHRLKDKGIELVEDPEEVLIKYPDCWVIGGQSLYEQFMPYAKELRVTRIYGEYIGDTYAPELPDDFRVTSITDTQRSKLGISYRHFKYERLDSDWLDV